MTRHELTYNASPTMAKFHQDDSFIRAMLGPIGSGKSTAAVIELRVRAESQVPGPDGVRRTRWLVGRNTYRELADTTLQTFRDWWPGEPHGAFTKGDMTYRLITKDLHVEVLFRSFDNPEDVSKLLSLELTGAWINESREVPRAVIDMLLGRVGRYPAARDGGCAWSGILLDSNPPDTDHWMYRRFEEDRPEGWRLYRQPGARSVNAENLANLPAGYYERLVAANSEDWCRVYVDGEYGYVQDGKPVFPEYTDSVHAADTILRPLTDSTVVIGLDFGLTPAAVFCQRDAKGRWLVLHELVTEDMGVSRFAELLAGDMGEHFPGQAFSVWGDPAGNQRSQIDADETCFKIIRARGIKAMPAPSNDFTVRREAVANCLGRLVDGRPGLMVSPKCAVLRKGLAGGYCFRRLRVAADERYQDKPDKGLYSHVADALQYALLGGGENPTTLNQQSRETHVPRVGHGESPLQWDVFNT